MEMQREIKIVEQQEAQLERICIFVNIINMDEYYDAHNFGMSYLNVKIYGIGKYHLSPKMSYKEEVEHNKVLYIFKQERQKLLMNIRFQEAQLATLRNPNSLSVNREEYNSYEEDYSY